MNNTDATKKMWQQEYRVTLAWTQRGHNTLDPSGWQLFQMQATWTTTPWHNVHNAVQAAQKYAASQNWESHRINIEAI